MVSGVVQHHNQTMPSSNATSAKVDHEGNSSCVATECAVEGDIRFFREFHRPLGAMLPDVHFIDGPKIDRLVFHPRVIWFVRRLL